MHNYSRAGRFHVGFSLLELMIALVISAILSGSAVVYYRHDALRARRIDAKVALYAVAECMETYHFNHHTYTGASLTTLGLSAETQAHDYGLKIEDAGVDEYNLIAVPNVQDSECGTFSLNQVGAKQVSGTKGVAWCWS